MDTTCQISGCRDNGRWIVVAPPSKVITCTYHIGSGIEQLTAKAVTVVQVSEADGASKCDAHNAIRDAVQRFIDGHPGEHTNEDNPYDSCDLCLEWNETALKPYAAQLIGLVYPGKD